MSTKYRAFRRKHLKTPAECTAVANYFSDSSVRDRDNVPLKLPPSNTIRHYSPDNSSAPAGVDLSAESLTSGTWVLVEDTQGATANNITITAEGSFVDSDGVAVGQCVIDADDGFALFMIAGGVSVLVASKGVDLTP